jgi:predicted amidophosphoribosyltransferase
MATCCGAKHLTPFCPSCGAKLRHASALDGLLEHCRKQANYKDQAARKIERRVPPEDERPHAREYRLERPPQLRKVAAKWRSWAEALAALLEGTGNLELPGSNGRPPADPEAAKIRG